MMESTAKVITGALVIAACAFLMPCSGGVHSCRPIGVDRCLNRTAPDNLPDGAPSEECWHLKCFRFCETAEEFAALSDWAGVRYAELQELLANDTCEEPPEGTRYKLFTCSNRAVARCSQRRAPNNPPQGELAQECWHLRCFRFCTPETLPALTDSALEMYNQLQERVQQGVCVDSAGPGSAESRGDMH